MVGERGLRDVEAEGAAAPRLRVLLGEGLNDPQPVRVAQRVEHAGELEVFARWVMEAHGTSIR